MKKDLSHLDRLVVSKGKDGGRYEFAQMVVIASWGGGWDHVSASKKNECPSWGEMDYIKSLFFEDCEVVMQLHVDKKNHINNHPYCLHLWRPQGEKIPLPPGWMVGIATEAS